MSRLAQVNRSWKPQDAATPGRQALSSGGFFRIGPRGLQVLYDRQDSNKATATVAGVGARAPLLYGRVQAPGLIAAVKVQPINGLGLLPGLYLLVVWGEGEITQIERLVAGGEASGAARHDYLGTAAQGADPWLAAVMTDYTDTLRGTYQGRAVALAYSVLHIPASDSFPNAPTAIIRGLKLYDPRTGLTAYSTNPALMLGDLLTRAGEVVDWAASLDAINYCDETVHEQPRWTCSLTIANPADIAEHVDQLRGYAHCLIDYGSTGIRLIPDKATSISRALTAADILAGSLTLSRPARRDTPTYLRIGYTDTAPPAGARNGPWGTAYATAAHPGLTTGTPWVESGLTLPGIQSRQEASRTAIERLNAYTLRNLYAEATIRDSGLAVAVGDVVALTHPLGLEDKPMRVLAVDDTAPGRYKIRLEEYDAAVYSNAVTDDPTYPDGSLPSPFDVPAPATITVTEDVYQQLDGTYASRLMIGWSADDYPYAHSYEVRVFRDGVRIYAESGPDAEAVTPAILPRHTYEIKVRLVAAIGITGPWGSISLYIAGKNFPPTNVATLNAVEMGGEVRLSWTNALDTDIWRYEVRWGAAGGSWDTAKLLDRVDSLRLVTNDIPAGTWAFHVKALDSIGQYSATAASRELLVTLDNSAFFVGDATLVNSPANCVATYAYTDRFGNFTAWSQQGTTVTALWANNASTYTGLACAYDLGGASKFVTAQWDLGAIGTADLYAGQLTANVDGITALAGTLDISLDTSLNGSTWTAHAATSLRTELAYARVSATAASGEGFLVRAAPYVRLDVFSREETGTVTTSAAGPTTVTLSNTYYAVKNLLLTPSGTATRAAVYDNIITGDPSSFDVYLFNAAGTKIAGAVSWRFQGV